MEQYAGIDVPRESASVWLCAAGSYVRPICGWLLLARVPLGEQLGKLQKRLVSLACDETPERLLMSTPGVGVLVALTYVAAIKRSGETDVTGRISKIGDASVRTALYEAANVILTRPVKGSSLKELGDAPGQPRRNAQGEGSTRAQACRCPASDAAD